MSRFPRLRRSPDQWRDAHDRARVRAAERLDGPLGLVESQWLDEHLAGCPDCSAVAAAYAADREALRALRSERPEPPRDLWARTAASIEQLSLRSEGASQGPASIDRPAASPVGRLRGLPLSAMTTVAVVVVVFGATLLMNGSLAPAPVGPQAAGSPGIALASSAAASGAPGAEATPYAVKTRPVAWVDAGPGGVSYSTHSVEQVCPEEGSANCAPLPDEPSTKLALDTAPKTLIGSPSSKQAVAISKTATAGDQVVIVQLPDSSSTASPSPTPSRSATPTASTSDAASAPPNGSEAPASPTPTVVVETAAPSESPLQTPQATSTELAIASGIQVVGESAAFSADGSWFAFTARSKDGTGPDVYVWRVGDTSANRLTTDGTSYFGSWSGDRAVVSRPADPTARVSDPVSVLIDPATGEQQLVGALWRPVLDPTGRFAIGWNGSLTRTNDPLGWAPSNGRLTLRTWTSSGDGGDPKGSDEHHLVADHAPGDFDARWDETGEWVAVWVGNDADASIGELTLYHLDAKNERLEHVKGAPEREPALSGFSNAGGALAWATPRGNNGEGSRVQVAAWSTDKVGIVASNPGEDPVLIR